MPQISGVSQAYEWLIPITYIILNLHKIHGINPVLLFQKFKLFIYCREYGKVQFLKFIGPGMGAYHNVLNNGIHLRFFDFRDSGDRGFLRDTIFDFEIIADHFQHPILFFLCQNPIFKMILKPGDRTKIVKFVQSFTMPYS